MAFDGKYFCNTFSFMARLNKFGRTMNVFKSREEEHAWVLRMVALEDKLGELPPGGFGGGTGFAFRRRELANAKNDWENEGGAFIKDE